MFVLYDYKHIVQSLLSPGGWGWEGGCWESPWSASTLRWVCRGGGRVRGEWGRNIRRAISLLAGPLTSPTSPLMCVHSDKVLLHSPAQQALSSYQVSKSSKSHLNKQKNPSICKQSRRESFLIILIFYTSVAMTHSFLSSVMTNTDWYMESLEEHIVDILHSGFSLYILPRGFFSSKHFSLWCCCSLSSLDSSSL